MKQEFCFVADVARAQVSAHGLLALLLAVHTPESLPMDCWLWCWLCTHLRSLGTAALLLLIVRKAWSLGALGMES